MYAAIFKANKYHDSKDGRFTTGAGAGRMLSLAHDGKNWTAHGGGDLPAEAKEKIKGLNQAIPKAWTNVSIDLDSNKKVVSGVDSKGRPTAIYTKEHHEAQGVAKHERVERLDPHVSKLMSKASKSMLDSTKSARERDDAATVYLIGRTAFRPGSPKDTKADQTAYGASTLKKEHIKVEGDTVSFSFPSKSGQTTIKILKDKTMAKYLTERLPTLSDSDRVFRSSGASAGKFLKKSSASEFLIKDLRTWNGTSVAKKEVDKLPLPRTEKELQKLQKAVATKVAKHLGNTPAIAFKDYINPKAWPPILVGPVKKMEDTPLAGDFYTMEELQEAYAEVLREPNSVIIENPDLLEGYEPEVDWEEEYIPPYPKTPLVVSKFKVSDTTITL